MTVHRYPFATLFGDYAKGAAGMGVSGGLWALAPGAQHLMVICGSLAAMFLLFTLRTAMRHRTRIVVTPQTIGAQVYNSGRETTLSWKAIDTVRLRYYSTRRQRDQGWMTLTLAADGRRLAIDSTLDGFAAIAARAAKVADERGLALSEATRANLAALGLPVADTTAIAESVAPLPQR